MREARPDSTTTIDASHLGEKLERASYEREVLRHRPELTAAAIRLTKSRADADDLVQEAVLRAWAHWDRFEPGTNGRAWMHRILFNTFVNGYRKRRREHEILVEVHTATSHARKQESRLAASDEGLSDEVEEALSHLQDEFRQVLVLVDVEDRSYREAADAIGCPIGTVMSRLHRARRAMQRELAGFAARQGYVRPEATLVLEAAPTLEAA